MTDIVERLRNPGRTPGCPDCGAVALHEPTVTRDMAEAADEIERLRAALWDLVSDCEEYVRINKLHNNDGSPATNHAMRRARAALGGKP